MQFLISLFLGIIAVVGALFIGIYWGVISPILSVAEMLDTDTLTFSALAWEIIKFMFRGILSVIWLVIFFSLAGINIARK